jgi:hypothetical protein
LVGTVVAEHGREHVHRSCSALDAQAVLRKEPANRERRLEALPVACILGKRDALVRGAEHRAGHALRTLCRLPYGLLTHLRPYRHRPLIES